MCATGDDTGVFPLKRKAAYTVLSGLTSPPNQLTQVSLNPHHPEFDTGQTEYPLFLTEESVLWVSDHIPALLTPWKK